MSRLDVEYSPGLGAVVQRTCVALAEVTVHG